MRAKHVVSTRMAVAAVFLPEEGRDWKSRPHEHDERARHGLLRGSQREFELASTWLVMQFEISV